MNKVTNGSVEGNTEKPSLHIISRNDAAIKKLLCNKFTLTMENGFLKINDFKLR